MEEIPADVGREENTKMQTPLGEDGYFLAGERVEAGRYRQIGSGRVVTLERDDLLPASLDGRVACYERVQWTWADLTRQTMPTTATLAGRQ